MIETLTIDVDTVTGKTRFGIMSATRATESRKLTQLRKEISLFLVKMVDRE